MFAKTELLSGMQDFNYSCIYNKSNKNASISSLNCKPF